MPEPIRFHFRGAVQEVVGAPPTRTILQHLREDLHCTGTKEGCAEGDRGACTVVVGQLEAGRVALKSVNACIQFLPTLDGKALFTVEDLKLAGGKLHPVQQAMVECHASQCGFCTPGFVMSLWNLYLHRGEEAGPPARGEIDRALSGNLCRCTGYRPIIEAARRHDRTATCGIRPRRRPCPLPAPGSRFRAYKLSKRFDQDISAVCAAFAVRLGDAGVIEDVAARIPAWAEVGRSRPHESAALHVSGDAIYVDDIPEVQGTLHGALGLSQKAHAVPRRQRSWCSRRREYASSRRRCRQALHQGGGATRRKDGQRPCAAHDPLLGRGRRSRGDREVPGG